MPIPKILDAVILKNGDFVNGKVLTKYFNLKTSYGEIKLKRKDVKNIHMKGTQFTKDEILTMELNKFSGTLKEKIIEVKLKSGQKIEIEKNKIHTIMMLTNRTSK